MSATRNDDRRFSIAILDANVTRLQEYVDGIKVSLKADYVQKLEFQTVRSVVFGLVGGILIAAVGVLVALVIRI